MSESRGSTTWVQPIVVDKTGTHWATIQCAAASSALARLATPGLDAWAQWEADGFAKTVRRASPAAYDQALADTSGAEVVSATGSRAFALPPCPSDTLPRRVARLQVTGTNLPPEDWRPHGSLFTVVINDDADMSTGKAAAQAAHAVHEVVNTLLSPEQLAWWDAQPTDFMLYAAAGETFAQLSRDAALTIIDAGHTELIPNTTTALVLLGAALDPARTTHTPR